MARALHSQFCDDIRQEVGNKLSMMGIYHVQMVVPSFPFELNRLFVSMKATATGGDEFKALKFMVLHDDNVIVEMDVDDESLQQVPLDVPEFRNATGTQSQQIFQTIFPLPPIVFNEPGILRTRIVTERDTMAGDGLMIIQNPVA